MRNDTWHPIAGGITEYKLKRTGGRLYCIVRASYIDSLGYSNGRHYHKHVNIANVSSDFKPFDFNKTLDIRFNLFIDSRIYRNNVLNDRYPFWDQKRLKKLKTLYPHKWIEIGENLAYKLKDGYIFFKFDPSLIIGDSESKYSVLICSNRGDHYLFKKLFDHPYVIIFNSSEKLNKKEKNYLKGLELCFNCFENVSINSMKNTLQTNRC